jgi:alkylation response protein AidB-like acyl-CoA dehydrogenase
MHATTDAVQIFGGLGVTTFAAVERFFRDAKVAQIYEGTNQVQRVVISTHILR